MNTTDNALIEFGRHVLQILEEDPEWNSDTLDRIACSADSHGLARTDGDGQFLSVLTEVTTP